MAGAVPESRDLVGLLTRGFAMGLVEVLPGISGGTIALLTGIYDRLVSALADLTIWTKNLLQKRDLDIPNLFRSLAVILPLALGMVVGFGTSVVFVSHILDTQPMLVWGGVFGLVAGAVLFTGVSSKAKSLALFTPIGLVFAVLLNLIPVSEAEAPLIVVFVGAVLAFGAWILPGISGSFVLLLLGVWTTMVHAFASLDLLVLAVFGIGLKIGFLVFSHPIRVLLVKHRDNLMAVFCGLLAGSLWRIWPWNSAHVQESSVFVVVLVMCSAFFVICVLTYAKNLRET